MKRLVALKIPATVSTRKSTSSPRESILLTLKSTGNSKKVIAAPRWLWENVAIPELKQSVYDKQSFTHFWKRFWEAKQEFHGKFQRLFSPAKKNQKSLVSSIGNTQNLKASSSITTSARVDPRRKPQSKWNASTNDIEDGQSISKKAKTREETITTRPGAAEHPLYVVEKFLNYNTKDGAF